MSIYQAYIRILCIASLYLLAPASGWAQADPTTPPPLPSNQVATITGTATTADKSYSSVADALDALTAIGGGTITLNISTTLTGTHTLNEGLILNLNGLKLTCSSGTSLITGNGKIMHIINKSAASTSSLSGSFSFSGGLFIDANIEMANTRVYRDKELRYRVLVQLPSQTGTFSDLFYGPDPIDSSVKIGNLSSFWLPENASPQTISYRWTEGSKTGNYQTDPIVISRHQHIVLSSKEAITDTTKPVIKITKNGSSTNYLKLEEGLKNLTTGSAQLLQNAILTSEVLFANDATIDLASYHLTGNEQAALLTSGNNTLKIKSTIKGSMSGNFRITNGVWIDKSVTLTANILVGTSQMYRTRIILTDNSYTYYKYNTNTFLPLTHRQTEDGKQVAYLWLPALSTPTTFQIAQQASGINAKTSNNIVIEANHDNEVDMTIGDIQAIVYKADNSEEGRYPDFHKALDVLKSTTGKRLVLQSNVSLTEVSSHALDKNVIASIDLNRYNLFGGNGTLEAIADNSCYLITDKTSTGSIDGKLKINGHVYIGNDIAASKIGNIESNNNLVYRLLVKIDDTIADGFYQYNDGSSKMCYVKNNIACLWMETGTNKTVSFTIGGETYTTSDFNITATHSNTITAHTAGMVAKIENTSYKTLTDAFKALNKDNQEIEIINNCKVSTEISTSYKVTIKNNHQLTMETGGGLKSGGSGYIFMTGNGSVSGDFTITGKVYISASIRISESISLSGKAVYRTQIILPESTTAATFTSGGNSMDLFFSGEKDALNKVITYTWMETGTYTLTITITVPSSSTLEVQNANIAGLHTNRFDMTAGDNVAQVGNSEYTSFVLALAKANELKSEVILLNNVVLREKQIIKEDVTINLNSHILSTTADAFLEVATGKVLTITDTQKTNPTGSLYGTLRLEGTVYVNPRINLAGTIVRNGIEVYRMLVHVPGITKNEIVKYTDATALITDGYASIQNETGCFWFSPITMEHDLLFTANSTNYELTLIPTLPNHNAKEKAYKTIKVEANTSWVGSDYKDYNVFVANGFTLTIPANSTLTSLHRIIQEKGSQVVCQKEELLVTSGIIYRCPFITPNVWESFSLPFNTRRITAMQGGELIEMQPYQEMGTGGHFWLKTLAADGSFQYVTEERIRANEGYLISVPNNLVQQGENQIDFVSPANQYLKRTPVPAIAPVTSGFKQLANGTYHNLEIRQPYYLLSADGTTYNRQIPTIGTPGILPPFCSYLLADSQTTERTNSLRLGSIATGNEEVTQPAQAPQQLILKASRNQLRIDTAVSCRLQICNPSGQWVVIQQIPAGTTLLTMTSGLYFVNRQKIYIP